MRRAWGHSLAAAMIFCFSFAMLHFISIGRQHASLSSTTEVAHRDVALASFLQTARTIKHGPIPSFTSSSSLPSLFPPVTMEETATSITISNGFVNAVFDKTAPALKSLAGDFLGKGDYGGNTLAEPGLTIDTIRDPDTIQSSAINGAGAPIKVTVIKKTKEEVTVEISGIVDNIKAPMVQETWTLTLSRGSRSLAFQAEGTAVVDLVGVRAARSIPMRPTSMYGLYDAGTEQMKAGSAEEKYYVSKDTLPRLYALGGWGNDDYPMAGDLCLTIERDVYPGNGMTVLKASKEGPVFTQLIELVDGYATNPPDMDTWASSKWMDALLGNTAAPKGKTWKSSIRLLPNNHDFPLLNMSTSDNLPIEDLGPMLTGIYANPVGNLRNRINSVERGKAHPLLATTLRYPEAWYSTDYNFFDPDNYFAVWAILIAGQPHLDKQVRDALELNGQYMHPNGQIPHHFTYRFENGQVTDHHFIMGQPVYRAISGELQPGPNIFWVLSCFHYAKFTQDLDWLREYMPTLRKASAFLFKMMDNTKDLASVPGALMIDVFLRNNFATDTNSMLVGFLREFADAEEAVGDAEEAARLRGLSDKISAAVDRLLWDEKEDDHFITQLNHDGSSKDYVDYDSNLLALANGVTSPERAARAFQRIDKGKHAHVAPTYVSERYYGQSDTTMGNIGDSACTMGRVAWFDALARKRYGDLHAFENVLVNPLRDDLKKWTWMHERYGSDGLPSLNRTNYYFEYPSVVSVMLHDLRYGIEMGFGSVTIDPFGPNEYSYHVGTTHIHYSANALSIQTPAVEDKLMRYKVHDLPPLQVYSITVRGCGDETERESRTEATSGTDGILRFQALGATQGKLCVVEAVAKQGGGDGGVAAS